MDMTNETLITLYAGNSMSKVFP